MFLTLGIYCKIKNQLKDINHCLELFCFLSSCVLPTKDFCGTMWGCITRTWMTRMWSRQGKPPHFHTPWTKPQSKLNSTRHEQNHKVVLHIQWTKQQSKLYSTFTSLTGKKVRFSACTKQKAKIDLETKIKLKIPSFRWTFLYVLNTGKIQRSYKFLIILKRESKKIMFR